MAIRSWGPVPGFGGTTSATHERVRLAMIEALESIASPEVARRIVAEALAADGLERAPDRSRELSRFGRGPLRRAVQVVLGLDAAELVETAVLAVAAHLDDGVDEITEIRAASTAPPEPIELRKRKASTRADSGHEPIVLVATSDPLRVSVVERAAQDRGAVSQVEDLMALLDAAQAEPRRATLIIVDCLSPSVQVPTLAVVAPDLPRGTRIVLWGISDDAWMELHGIHGEQGTQRFARADVGDAGVDAAVRRFVG